MLANRGMVLANAQMDPRLFDLDFQLLADAFLMLLAVIVLFFALSYLLFNPARAFLNKRKEKIREELDDARNNQLQAEQLKQNYDGKMREINKEAEAILSDTRKKAMQNESRMLAEAKEEAARIIAHAQSEAQLEKKRVADEVKQEMVSVASEIAKKAVGQSMNQSIQEELVNETLREIGDATWQN